MNRDAFFARIKTTLFRGTFSQSQVDGLNRLLDAMGRISDRHKAYMLATAYHEGAYTMQPITEYGGRRYFDKYDTGRLAKALGNTPEADGDGYKYRGRGDVMITGRRNYELFSNILGIDLVNNPDLALDPATSARILVKGCNEGRFTGKKLKDFQNFLNMRKVVNGMDDARLIAGYADKFYEALTQPAPLQIPERVVTGDKPHQSKTLGMLGVGGLSEAARASGSVRDIISNLGVSPDMVFAIITLAALGYVAWRYVDKKKRHGI